MANAAKTIKVSGTLSFLDDENNARHPLAGMKVELYNKKYWISIPKAIATTYTDNNGKYCFNFNNKDGDIKKGSKLFLRAYTEAEHCKVSKQGTKHLAYHLDSIRYDVDNKENLVIDCLLKTDTTAGKAYEVLMILRAGTIFVRDQLGMTPTFVDCTYPGTTYGFI